MKTRFAALPVAALLCFAAHAQQAPATPPAAVAPPAPAAAVAEPSIPGKTAYVDMEMLFQGYYKTAQYDASMKKQKELYENRIADGIALLEKDRKEINQLKEKSTNPLLSEEVRQKAREDAKALEQSLRDTDKELREFSKNKDAELNRRYLELRNEIVKEINDYVRAYGRKERYEALFDTSGVTRNFIPTIVYFDERKDLTLTLLADLNKGHESEAHPVEEIKAKRAQIGIVPLDAPKPPAPPAPRKP